jgi:hypothetical protein
VPADRQVLTLFLPIEGGKGRYQQAMARNSAAAASPGMPHKVMIAKDAPSQAVVDVLATAGAVPNIMIGGQSLQDMMAQAGAGAAVAAAADPADQLAKLAALRDRGVLTDGEFAAQKAKILGGWTGPGSSDLLAFGRGLEVQNAAAERPVLHRHRELHGQ